MIPHSHKHFLKWSVWMHSNLGQTGGMGYGSTVTQKVIDGKGSILPGAPKGSGPVVGESDPVASMVDTFICKQLDSTETRIVKVFYLTREGTAEDKAKILRIAERTLYDHLHQIHIKLDRHLQLRSLRDRM